MHEPNAPARMPLQLGAIPFVRCSHAYQNSKPPICRTRPTPPHTHTHPAARPPPSATHYGDDERHEVDPLKGNVAFAAALYGWSFTLQSFASLYVDVSAGVGVGVGGWGGGGGQGRAGQGSSLRLARASRRPRRAQRRRRPRAVRVRTPYMRQCAMLPSRGQCDSAGQSTAAPRSSTRPPHATPLLTRCSCSPSPGRGPPLPPAGPGRHHGPPGVCAAPLGRPVLQPGWEPAAHRPPAARLRPSALLLPLLLPAPNRPPPAFNPAHTHLTTPHRLPAAAETRTFSKKAPPGGGERTFVQFILEPLYKIYAQARRGSFCCLAARRGSACSLPLPG